MRVDDLRYHLPPEAIAQHPVEPRDCARLLVALGDEVEHRQVADLAQYVGPGDVIVVNDTRVLPARLHLRKRSGGAVEVLLLAPRDPDRRSWEALVRPGRRVPPGTELLDGTGPAVLVAGSPVGDAGLREVTFVGDAPVEDTLGRLGAVPLPPYIHEPLRDPERYQTVFARDPGSVAAPTAGLHLTPSLLDACRATGAAVTAITLDVGLATFQPIATEHVADHRMHAERYTVPPETIAACDAARRVLAVGTTALRALETFAATGSATGTTELFIHGDYAFKAVDVLLTNFHLPGSSLLALLDSFTGPRWRELYALALTEGYRFLSFGDAMLVSRR